MGIPLPDDFDWRAEWPVGTRLLILGRLNEVFRHGPHGPHTLELAPYAFFEGRWRETPTFADIKRLPADPGRCSKGMGTKS